ncbi:MAG TPA: SGNH/GDSL hydrolase family protein [Natronosporangium sp.]|nr:SGNH/GDSL hydrolase family protein [Natronosporangium sp.]
MTSLARRLRRAATYSLAAGLVGGVAVIAAEVVAARTRRYATPALGLALRATIGPPEAPPLRLTLLGDATALGVGVDSVSETLGGQLAELLSSEGEHAWRVELSSVAVAGSHCADLGPQVARALLGPRPDVAVILIGARDATDLRRPTEAATHLAAAVRRLRDAGVEVVVGTCPDLGAARAFAPPLRQLVGWLGRRIADAQAPAAHVAGADVVDLATETGPVFRADPGTLCFDGFHPSADGYRVWAHALYPAVAAAAHATTIHE